MALFATGCGAEPSPPSFEEIVRTHAAPDLEEQGVWSSEGPNSATLFIDRADNRVLNLFWITEKGSQPSTGMRSGAVLLLQSPVDGIQRLYFCRFGRSEVLLPDQGCWFEPGDPPIPHGAVFTRQESPALRAYLPGPEDENTPAPWRDAYGDGTGVRSEW